MKFQHSSIGLPRWTLDRNCYVEDAQKFIFHRRWQEADHSQKPRYFSCVRHHQSLYFTQAAGDRVRRQKNSIELMPFIKKRRCQHISVQYRGSTHGLLQLNLVRCINDADNQCLQNSLARVVLQQARRTHAEPIVRSLHWLPVEHRVLHKLYITQEARRQEADHSQQPRYFSCTLILSVTHCTTRAVHIMRNTEVWPGSVGQHSIHTHTHTHTHARTLQAYTRYSDCVAVAAAGARPDQAI